METAHLRDLLTTLQQGKIEVEEVLQALQDLPFSDLGFATIDHHRSLRNGLPEVIFCQKKEPEHVETIIRDQIRHEESVFGTRASPALCAILKEKFPRLAVHPAAHCFSWKSPHWSAASPVQGNILIVSAGTADFAVAEEARLTLDMCGHPCEAIHDVGVAGIHRLLARRREIHEASVIIVVAGMEGALPSVVAGMAACPVIGVPTSVGYGSHLQGLVPLFAMLNSCAGGLTVVNIDNGFGAAVAAAAMNRVYPSAPRGTQTTR